MAETNNKPKPVKVGDIIIVKAEEEGYKGDYITKKDNFVIIIRNAQANKKYEVQITAVNATYAFCKIRKEIKEETAEEINKRIEKEDEED